MAIVDDLFCSAAFAADGGEGATAIEGLPTDVLALVLGRLDGASLATLGCASAAFRDLAANPATWRALCLALWPSLRDVPSADHKGNYRRLFADAFPFPAASPPPAPPAPAQRLPTRLVSAIDLLHGGACVMSRVVETDAASGWFLGAPFRVDALVQEGFTAPAAPIAPADLSLSWVLIDPDTGRAVNASSRRPVSVDRRWLTGETVARFAVVLGGGVALDATVTCDERLGHVREVSLRIEDGDGGGVSGRDGLAVVAAAMAGTREGRGAEAAARLRYEEFVKGRAARKERKARREGIVDLCCSGVGAAAFLGFLVMLTFR
ncbi:unnamed protein product [Urochloa decumbens]|uniref:F-box domain-containing protein n=1 Tax=Urochloa decumbens TaxID=240449 RepID=A0ABC8W8U5_9POAL